MRQLNNLARLLLVVTVLFGAIGCNRLMQDRANVEKDPHVLAGQARFRARNYRGAIEAFDKALRVNPNNWAAHFELGLIYYNEDRLSDSASAIYHFQRLLNLNPNHHMADQVKDYIKVCKVRLGSEIYEEPAQPAIHRHLASLQAENKQLKQRVENLMLQLTALSNAPPVRVQQAANNLNQSGRPAVGSRSPRVQQAVNRPTPPTAQRPSNRTYAIKKGDTLWGIAKKHGITVKQLQAANRRVNARSMKPGTTLVIPPR